MKKVKGERGSLSLSLVAILLASLVFSLFFAARLPLDANPDERAHLDYIRLIVENHGFVRFVPGDTARFEVHQPPLYYLLCVPVYILTGGSVFAIRLVAALLQLATIVLVFYACRDLFPGRRELALGAAGFGAFLPAQAQLAGAINNDALTTLICAAIFWLLARLVKSGQDTRGAILLGVLLGVGWLTKLSVLQLLPALLIAYGLAAHVQVITARLVVRQCLLTLGLGLFIASPWLLRNTLLYGDPLTLKIYLLTGPNFTPDQVMQAFGWSFGDYLRNVGVRSYATFWYLLPPNLPPNRFTGAPGPLLLVIALGLGGLLGTLRWLLRLYGEPGQRRAIWLYLAGTALLIPFFTRFILTTFQAQGRYFLPALLPISLVCCLGWSTLTGRARLAGSLGPAAILLAMTLYILVGGAFFP